MAVVKRGKHWYGQSQADIRTDLRRYSKGGYPVQHFADAVCQCGHNRFLLKLDDNEGAAVRTCVACNQERPIGESADYLDGAELQECECPCGASVFEITAGVSLYSDSDDVRWLYLGCRCSSCGLLGCYGDWKNEFEDFEKLLARV